MWIVVGLGNPGAEYAHTRHNIGFMVVETVARRWNVALRDRSTLRVGDGQIAGRPVRLVEPLTFMNRSGAVLADLDRAPDDAMLVVYDDVDLPAGQIRVRRRGSSAGHRGVASIVERFDVEFARVRVGIGRPPTGCEVAEYVLQPLRPSELDGVREGVERASDAVECVVTDGVDAAMNRFNTRALPDQSDEGAS